MAAWCGLRFGELAALRKNRIDLDTETVMVAESASVLAGGVRHVGPPKPDAGRRTVAIPATYGSGASTPSRTLLRGWS